MKKYLVATLILVLDAALIPSVAQAQFYSGYTYNNNAMMNYAMASQRAKAAGRRGRVKKHSTRRKTHPQRRNRHRSHKRVSRN